MPHNPVLIHISNENRPILVCHVDSEGHAYDFGFGMNWSGVIDDDRVRKFCNE